MVRVTVFGAGAMGTATAMHLARNGNRTFLWASEFDQNILPALVEQRRHPVLPEHLPDSLKVIGPEALGEAVGGIDIAVMGAHSGGARTLARIVTEGRGPLSLVVGVAKGLEPNTLKRMSEVYAEEVGHDRVISVGGPCLAGEVAQGLPCSVIFASEHAASAQTAAEAFRSPAYHVRITDDLLGVEYCMVAKNVAAIGLGILDGLGKGIGFEYRNAKAALFSQACAELVELVVALGGRAETANGLAGLGDALVTSLGGRNRLFGELLGEAVSPNDALSDLMKKGMTVEGVESSRDVARLAEGKGLRLPFFEQIHRIVFDGAPAVSVLDCLEG
ncbi:MAG TPA: NAD(P)H-dependent glycerol-3-phosphate dehydrogenase [Actinomycetota bacterium]|nr:NAD(P)H-dependent glycerol-3-phosphate dehydrogenase [Actinomycetota bacterium]